MVPRQFSALLRRRRDHHLRQEFGPAIICQTIHASAGHKQSYTTYMPSWGEGDTPDAPDENWKVLLAKTKILHASHGGV